MLLSSLNRHLRLSRRGLFGLVASPQGNSRFGWSLTNIGDLDNDGVTDMASGAFEDLELYLQSWTVDPGAIFGLSGSNTVKGVVP